MSLPKDTNERNCISFETAAGAIESPSPRLTVRRFTAPTSKPTCPRPSNYVSFCHLIAFTNPCAFPCPILPIDLFLCTRYVLNACASRHSEIVTVGGKILIISSSSCRDDRGRGTIEEPSCDCHFDPEPPAPLSGQMQIKETDLLTSCYPGIHHTYGLETMALIENKMRRFAKNNWMRSKNRACEENG